jgi:hypothetical protein
MIKADNKDILNKKITGQYVQKEFIIDIASWISPAFYFKCSKIVNYFFIELYKKNMELKDQQLREAKEAIQFKLINKIILKVCQSLFQIVSNLISVMVGVEPFLNTNCDNSFFINKYPKF